MKHPNIVLASASPRRVDLLKQIVPVFSVMPSDEAEIHDEQLTAWEMAQVNAYRKARVIAKKFPDAWVIGADTLVYLDRESKLYGKPKNMTDATRMISELHGKTHAVITGVCLIHLRSHRHQVFAEWTDVTFHSLAPKQISDYLALINPLDKAGAYAIQEHGELIVAGVSGSFSNVVGLPVERLGMVMKALELA